MYIGYRKVTLLQLKTLQPGACLLCWQRMFGSILIKDLHFGGICIQQDPYSDSRTSADGFEVGIGSCDV